jgi:hypothetical protein
LSKVKECHVNTDIHPPIENRTTEQLLDIVETKEQWRDDVVLLTRQELLRRGISLASQELRRKSKNRFQKKIESIKSRATYTTIEKILIVLFGPILAIIFQDISMFQAGEGFKIKNRQGIAYLLLGVSLWAIVFYVIYRLG